MAKTTYTYKVLEKSGRTSEGKAEADSEQALLEKISEMGGIPLSIEPVGQGLSREIHLFGEPRIKLRDLAQFTRSLATLLEALPLASALRTLGKENPNPTLARIINEIYEDVNAGKPISDAVEKHPKTFPHLMVAMLRASEATGDLGPTLKTIATNFEADVKLRGQIRSAMAYPIVVFVMAILMCAIMLIFIVPIFADMFESLGSELPLPTRILVFLSGIMKYAAPATLIAGAGFIWWWRNHKHDTRVREFLDPLKLKLPIFGGLVHKIALARFSRNFAHLLEAGVPIMKALDIVADTTGNIVFSRALQEAKASVNLGNPMHIPLQNHPDIFPATTMAMIKSGEESANIDTILHSVAKDYEEQVESTTQTLASQIEPLMILFLGVIVGAMIIALYMPIFSIFDQIK